MGKLVRPGQTVRDLVIKDLNDNVSTAQSKNVRHIRQSNVSLQVTFNPTWAIVDKLEDTQRELREHQAKCQRDGISLLPSREPAKDGEKENAARDGKDEVDDEGGEDTHRAKEKKKVIDKILRVRNDAQVQEAKLRKKIKDIRQVIEVRTQKLTRVQSQL